MDFKKSDDPMPDTSLSWSLQGFRICKKRRTPVTSTQTPRR
jgi:hypothetical protein